MDKKNATASVSLPDPGALPRDARVVWSLCVALVIVAWSGDARAQDSSNEGAVTEQFEVQGDQHTNILNVASSDVIPHLGWATGLLVHYAHEPLRIRSEEDDRVEDEVLVSSQTKFEIWGGVGFGDYVDLSVVLPLVLTSGNSSGLVNADGGGVAIGDVRFIPRARMMNREDFGGFGLGLSVPIHAPTGDPTTFTGGNLRVEPRLALDYGADSGFLTSLNVGYQFRERQVFHNVVSDDTLRLALGLVTPVGVEGLEVLGTLYGNVALEDNRDPNDLNETVYDDASSPVEFTAALRYGTPWGLQATFGGGAGLTSGVGAPVFRILASIGYQPLDWDEDGDGLIGDADGCPTDPEDFDDFEDDDGCPDHDNDGDRLTDDEDRCPNEGEDFDNFEDEDGCPDLDNDGDGIADTRDQCIDQPEDVDGFQDEDGCPEPDNDQDGVADADDQCKLVAEDLDGFEDEDGCPEYDNDGDRFCDPIVQEQGIDVGSLCQGVDQCPNEKEVINGFKDRDGCPDEGKSSVVVKKGKIELQEQIFFDSGKDSIRDVSFPILDQVAAVLETNTQVTKVMIEGHTDDTGNDAKNLQLSKDRAAAVRAYLMAKGIDASRLASEGHGEERPLVAISGLRGRARTAARAQNRRVEILILEIDGKPVDDPFSPINP